MELVASWDVLVEMHLPVEEFKQALGNLGLAARPSIILNLPVNVAPLIDANAVPVGISMGLKLDAIHEKGLESRHAEECDRDTDLHIAPKIRLDILSTELYKAIFEYLIEKSLIELGNSDLLLFDSFELDFFEVISRLLNFDGEELLGFLLLTVAFWLALDDSSIVATALRAEKLYTTTANDSHRHHLLARFDLVAKLRALSYIFHELRTDCNVSKFKLISQEDLREHLVIVSLKLIPSVICQQKAMEPKFNHDLLASDHVELV